MSGRVLRAIVGVNSPFHQQPGCECKCPWRVNVANAFALADTLCRERDHAVLFRTLATLRTDIVLFDDVDQLRWKGPTDAFETLAGRLDAAVTENRRAGGRQSLSTPIRVSAARR